MKTVAATPALQDAWIASGRSTGKVVATNRSGSIIFVQVENERIARNLEALNCYPFESFVKLHRAGFYVKRVIARYPLPAAVSTVPGQGGTSR